MIRERIEDFLECLVGEGVSIDVNTSQDHIRQANIECMAFKQDEEHYIIEDKESEIEPIYIPKNRVVDILEGFNELTIGCEERIYIINRA